MRAAVVLVLMVGARVASADDRDEARRHFLEAKKQYELGHFAEAAKEYEAGYNLFQRPGFLWDIAQSYRKLGDNEKALHFYKMYVLNAEPGTKAAVNVPEAQEQIRALEPLVAAQQKAKSAPPDGIVGTDAEKEQSAPVVSKSVARPTQAEAQGQPSAQVAEQSRRDWYRAPVVVTGFSLLGVAIVASGIGVGLIVHANDLDTELASAMSIPQADAIERSRDAYRVGSYAMFLLAGASAVTGAVLVGVGARRARQHQISFGLLPLHSGGMLLGVGGSL